MIFTDQLHRKITLPAIPQRIVSLVPSQTELLVDLGLELSLVGITKFCIHPPHLRKTKIVVGGTKQVNFDKIKALNPDIILCNKEENTQEMVLELEKITPVWVSDIKDIPDCLGMISAFGKLFQKEEQAEKITKTITENRDDFQSFIQNKPFRKTAYLIWKNPYMTVGADTFIDYLLRLNRFDNIYRCKPERYPEIREEELHQAEVILLSSEPYPFKEKHIEEFQKTYPNKKIILADGEYFSWYGSRLQYAFAYFRELQGIL